MSYFGDFLDDEVALVLSIPMRVAFWISHIDDVAGTTRDEERERAAAEKAIKKVFAETRREHFINDVLAQALAREDYWPEWDKASATVLDDVPRVMRLLRGRLPEAEVAAYQKAVFYVARVVSQAACEADDGLSRGGAGLGLFQKILDAFSVRSDLQAPENVSKTEKAALQKLLAALKG